MIKLKESSKARMHVMRACKMLELLLMISLFALCWFQHYEPVLPSSYSLTSSFLSITLYGIILLYAIRVYKGFEIGSYRVSELAYSQLLGIILTNAFYVVILLFLLKSHFSFTPILCVAGVETLISIMWLLTMNRLYFRITPPKPTIIVYRNEDDIEKLSQICFFDLKYIIKKKICKPKSYLEVVEQMEGISTIFVMGIDSTIRNGIVKHCINNGLLCYVAPKVGDMIIAGADHMQMFGLPIMRARRATMMPEYVFIKRVFDIGGALIGLVIASPIMFVTAMAIKLYDHGPIFYKQVRLTKGKKEFEIIKFRSMRVDAEKDGVARLACDNDARITPIGKVIRACRIDELPQLLNILRGDMTFVGPRPERPEIAEQYRKINSAFDLRLQVKAGLTGYAQIYGKYNTDPYDKLQLDLIYINHMSVAEDIRLMLATVKILFMKESTEGVKQEAYTATDEQHQKDRTVS